MGTDDTNATCRGSESNDLLGVAAEARSCDNCKFRGPWKLEWCGAGRRSRQVLVADCEHPNLPDFWQRTGERPFVFPGCGSMCQLFERIGNA